jgi:hypothetical protein
MVTPRPESGRARFVSCSSLVQEEQTVRLVFCMLLVGAGTASAQTRFGSKGTLTPSGFLAIERSSWSSHSIEAWQADLSPGAMYFITDNLAVGGFVNLSYGSTSFGSTEAVTTYGYGIAPSIGWNLWLGDRVSLFPQVSFHADWLRISGDPGSTTRVLTVQGFLPALFHVASHFYVGLGPSISREVDSTTILDGGGAVATTGDPGKFTRISVQSVIGGWF